MKNQIKSLTFSLFLLLVLSLALVSSAGAAPDPFIGVWTALDLDGSNLQLSIGGGAGNSYHLFYFDDGASVCGLDTGGDPLYPANAKGVGTATGDVLSVTFAVKCLAMPSYSYGESPYAFTYNSGTGTLTDGYGLIWTRK